jgi:hypothetical protein
VVIHESEPVPWEWLEAVHDGALLTRIRDGTMTLREQRGLGAVVGGAGGARPALGRRSAPPAPRSSTASG